MGGAAELRLVPPAGAATPRTEQFTNEKGAPRDEPEAAGQEGDEEVAPMGDGRWGKERLLPAMGAMRGKAILSGLQTRFCGTPLRSLGGIHSLMDRIARMRCPRQWRDAIFQAMGWGWRWSGTAS